MKCPKCGTAPHAPIQIKRKGMCRWCESKPERTINDIAKEQTESGGTEWIAD